MARHLSRLRRGITEALELGLLDKSSLKLLQPSSPAINLTAAMQFTMGTRTGPCCLFRGRLGYIDLANILFGRAILF